MTALVVFDIEAVLDFEVARRLLGRQDEAPDAEIRRMLGERYARSGEDPTTAFLKAHQPDEFVEMSELAACVAFMRGLARELCT